MADSLLDTQPTPDAGTNEEKSTETTPETEVAAEPAAEIDPNAQTFEEAPKEPEAEGELVFGKYKDQEAAEKAFKTLESENGRLRREKSPTAPEEYDFDLSKNEDFKEFVDKGVDVNLTEDPIIKALGPVFKENNISQDGVQAIVSAYMKDQMASMPDPAKEIEALGKDGENILKEVNNFVGKSFQGGEVELAKSIASTAEGVKFLHKISKISQSSEIPGEMSQGTQETSLELMTKASKLLSSNGGNLYGDNAREYDRLTRAAAEIDLKIVKNP